MTLILSTSLQITISLGDLILKHMMDNGAVTTFGYAASEAMGQDLDLVIPEHFRAAH